MQFNITFKTIFEYVLKKLVLCTQIRFVSTEKTTRIASRASCFPYLQNVFVYTKRNFLWYIFKYCFKNYNKLHEFANCNSANYDV